MELTVYIPDDIAERLGNGVNDDLSRRALEALFAEEYRLGHLNKPDLRRLLDFETGYEIDGFLKAQTETTRLLHATRRSPVPSPAPGIRPPFAHPPLIISCSSSSVRILTPSRRAVASLDPASSPATT
jgi:hypothetical protein